MIFNDDSLLDFRPTSLGDSFLNGAFGGRFGADVAEVVITGRGPGSLFLDDYFKPEFRSELVQPLDFSAPPVPLAEHGPSVDETPAAPVVGNDNEDLAAVALSRHVHEKTELPTQVADTGGHSDPGLILVELHDLAIPPRPAPADLDVPTITVTPPTFDGEPAPVIIGGRAYQSLSFLILDTPFVLGDGELPTSLRPTIDDLLGLTDDDDANAWVLPVGDGAGAWRLG